MYTKILAIKTSNLLTKKYKSINLGYAYYRKILNIAVLYIIYYYEIIVFVKSFSIVMLKK